MQPTWVFFWRNFWVVLIELPLKLTTVIYVETFSYTLTVNHKIVCMIVPEATVFINIIKYSKYWHNRKKILSLEIAHDHNLYTMIGEGSKSTPCQLCASIPPLQIPPRQELLLASNLETRESWRHEKNSFVTRT